MISTAGIWQGQDLLATLQEQTLRGLGLADEELRYVAPELLTGQAADVRSDVFTMGVLALRDGHGHAAVRRGLDAGAARHDAEGNACRPAGASAHAAGATRRAALPRRAEAVRVAGEFDACVREGASLSAELVARFRRSTNPSPRSMF